MSAACKACQQRQACSEQTITRSEDAADDIEAGQIDMVQEHIRDIKDAYQKVGVQGSLLLNIDIIHSTQN